MKAQTLTRREFLRAASMAAAGAALAGCKAPATTVPAEATQAPPAQPTAAPTAQPTAAAPATEALPAKIVAFTKEGDVSDGLVSCIDLVKEKTGLTLEVQSAPEDSFRAKVTADFAAGGGAYDIVMMPYNMMHEYQALGHLLPLDDYIAATPEINIEDFIPALLEAYGHWDGQQWALPGKADVYIACYRKDVMEDPAVRDLFKARTGMDLKPPKTVAEQKVIAEFFTKSLNPDSPLTYGWSNWSERWGSIWWFGARLAALGGTWLDENNHPGFNNEAGLTALKDYLDMHRFAPPDVATYDWGKANQAFLNGSTAFIDQWNSFGAECNTPEGYYGRSEVVGKTGFDVLTGYEVNGVLQQASVLGGWCISIPKYTKYPQAAWDALVVLTSVEAEVIREEKNMYSPTRRSSLEKIPARPNNEHFRATADNFAVAKIGADIYAPPIGQQLQDFLATTMHETIQGQHTAEEALALIEREWTKMLKDAGIYG